MVGVTNNVGKLGPDTQKEYEKLQASGHYPLMGQWKGSSKTYNDISFPVNHGISDKQVLGLKLRYKQEAILKIPKTGKPVLI